LSKIEEALLEGQAWVVDGQGTPGNYLLNVYICPESIAEYMNPKHPLLWGAQLTKGKASTHFVQRQSSTWHKPYSDTPTTPTPAKAPPLPAGVRFRCAGCGHWFTDTNLATHAKTGLCPGLSDAGQDWAIMCDKDCGCVTLDESSSCKPGFPRAQKGGDTVSETLAETPEEATPEEAAPAEPEAPADTPAEGDKSE
jgi:hypothetical protein